MQTLRLNKHFSHPNLYFSECTNYLLSSDKHNGFQPLPFVENVIILNNNISTSKSILRYSTVIELKLLTSPSSGE